MLGAAGPLALTDGGDLASFAFEAWQIRDGAWIKYGEYDPESMTIIRR